MTDISNPSGSIPPTSDRPASTVLNLETPVIPPADERRVAAPVAPAANPFENIKVEKPRTHPIAYAALALSVLALLLSVLAMGRGGDHGYRQVKVGANDCVIGRQGDADVLYCRAPTVP